MQNPKQGGDTYTVMGESPKAGRGGKCPQVAAAKGSAVQIMAPAKGREPKPRKLVRTPYRRAPV